MIGEPTMCFGCGDRFESRLLEVVGDTVFCRACLGKMLRRVDKRRESLYGRHGSCGHRGPLRVVDASTAATMSPVSAGDRVDLARPPAAGAPCFVCGEPLDGTAVIKLRGFTICARCSRRMLSEDAAVGAAADLAVSPAPPEIEPEPVSGTMPESRTDRG